LKAQGPKAQAQTPRPRVPDSGPRGLVTQSNQTPETLRNKNHYPVPNTQQRERVRKEAAGAPVGNWTPQS
ncbi:hypothetical protein SARC_13217, partial [Sphaeroforma arctica JP610]